MVLKKYQKEGFLCPNTVTTIDTLVSGVLGHYLKNHVEKLTLQVTQRCNLRCEIAFILEIMTIESIQNLI